MSGSISLTQGSDCLTAFRNRLSNVEKLTRVAWMACDSEHADGYLDCIEASIDRVVSDLMDVIDDMTKLIGDDPRARAREQRS